MLLGHMIGRNFYGKFNLASAINFKNYFEVGFEGWRAASPLIVLAMTAS